MHWKVECWPVILNPFSVCNLHVNNSLASELIFKIRMHSSRMRTVRSSSRGGVCLSACWDTNPPSRQPPDQAPPGSRPLCSRHPRLTRHPWEQTPSPTRHSLVADLSAADTPTGPGTPWEQTPPRPDTPLPCGPTHTCKNITFATSLRTVNILCEDNLSCEHIEHQVSNIKHQGAAAAAVVRSH